MILSGFAGEEIKSEVIISSVEEKQFKITEITSTIENEIKYKLTPIVEGAKYKLEIETRSGLKESFQGKIVLKTSSQKKPEVQLFVRGDVKSEVKVAPPYLYFGIIDTSKEIIDPNSLTRTVMVSKVKGGNLTIKNIETSKEWITTETKTIEKGKNYTVVIKLDKDKLPQGELKEKVIIQTNYDNKTELSTITLEAKVHSTKNGN